MPRILVVEDDPMIGSVLIARLAEDGHVVQLITDGPSAKQYSKFGDFDIVLLDLGLPGLDGLDVLRALRQPSTEELAPAVIVITARGSVEQRVAGLDIGADDYLVKPFAYEELLARIRAVTRRGSVHQSSILRAWGISLDESAATATGANGNPVALTKRELALLRALLLHSGQVLSRTQLEAQVYADEVDIESNAIDFLIGKLRAKLGASTIKNIRGLGWMVAKES